MWSDGTTCGIEGKDTGALNPSAQFWPEGFMSLSLPGAQYLPYGCLGLKYRQPVGAAELQLALG